MKKILLMLALLVPAVCFAQADRHEVRAGNRKFGKGDYRQSEIEYRKALLKDSTSLAANYNLASTLYRTENFDEAAKSLDAVKDAALESENAADWFFNAGDVALKNKDYGSAVSNFREALLRNPGDLAAKENYIYAKLMLQNQQNQQNQDQKQDQDQNQQDQNQNQQDQNQDKQDQQDQNQNSQDNQDQQQGQSPQLSKQQAQQMLKAVQAQEKKTKEKVDKEKAALLSSKEKEKNW